jgi:hypothetical protein
LFAAGVSLGLAMDPAAVVSEETMATILHSCIYTRQLANFISNKFQPEFKGRGWEFLWTNFAYVLVCSKVKLHHSGQ